LMPMGMSIMTGYLPLDYIFKFKFKFKDTF